MRFALVSQDKCHGQRFWIDPEQGDATGFMNWVHVLQGFHFSFDKLREDMSVLKDFDIVMMSGNPYNFRDIIQIANYLKPTQAVTMFYPEGSAQLYENSINSFSSEIYEAWNACDIFSMAEEDKASYYQSFIYSDTLVRFIHVPLRREMQDGQFLIPQQHKDMRIGLVYGDNNPNHPLIALACFNRLGMAVAGIDIDRGKASQISKLFPSLNIRHFSKLGQYPFLRILGRSYFHIYPTEWLGTARQQIACAVSGTPCIGNRDSHTQKRLFPRLGSYIYDIDGICALARELMASEAFYRENVEYAFRAAGFYSEEATVGRMVAAYKEALSKKKVMA